MSARLQVTLPVGWIDISNESPGSFATFVRSTSNQSGILKISIAEFNGRGRPVEDLDMIAGLQRMGERETGAILLDTAEGRCPFGRWGTTVFKNEVLPRFQLWMLTDNRDVILATHYFQSPPDPNEIREAQSIVESLNLKRRPWWQFW